MDTCVNRKTTVRVIPVVKEFAEAWFSFLLKLFELEYKMKT